MQILLCVMLTLAKAHLYSTCNLRSNISKDETKRFLQWYEIVNNIEDKWA